MSAETYIATPNAAHKVAVMQASTLTCLLAAIGAQSLTHLLFLLCGQVSELGHRASAAEGAAAAADAELVRLNAAAAVAAQERAEREAEAAQVQARLRAAEDKVQAVTFGE